MPSCFCHTETLEVSVSAGVGIADITADLQGIVERAEMQTGSLNAACIGSTGSLTTIEYEPGAVKDLQRAIRELAPPEREYEHEKAWQDGNGHSHVQAALLGPSLALPVRQGRVYLGTWQQVVVINHDLDARRRKIEVTLLGISA
ncbi:MAG: secondary thiamine-phosphate synthase enzyme YjbQ [Desulfohalobiaceae bacterium]